MASGLSTGFNRNLINLIDRSSLSDVQRKFSLKIMQFNVLANCLKEGESLEEFEVRKSLNVQYILDMQPSILLMEECDKVETYGDALGRNGYKVVADQKMNATKDWTCLFWKETDGLKLNDFQVQRFVAAAGDGGEDPASPGATSQFALHAQFSHHDEPLYVVGQHAKAGRKDNMEEKRIAHSKQLFSKLQSFVSSEEGVKYKDRIIWLGDMNAGPHTYGGKYPGSWYPWVMGEETEALRKKMISEGRTVIQHEPHCFSWSSALREARNATSSLLEQNRGECPHTTVKMRDGALICQTIDYIFYSKGGFQPISYVEPNPPEDMAPDFLPNNMWGSDHLAVYAELCPAKLFSKV